MRKNSHGRILKGESKEQYLGTVPKSCLIIYITHVYFKNITK